MFFRVFVLLASLSLWTGCERESGPQDAPLTSSSAAATPTAASPATAVAQVVFIDQEECCDCTQKRIDGTWGALQTALGEGKTVPVERIHLDTQKELAAPYTKAKPLMAPPGIYFMAENGDIVKMLQGQVTSEEIAAVLR